MKNYIAGWNANYLRGRANRYPYDAVVSFVLGRYGACDRETVRVLDLGCGGGNHLKFLKDEGFDFYGVDGSERSIELSRAFSGCDDPARIRVANFCALPFADEFFDAVIDRQSMGHNVLADVRRIVGEIYRILKPAGAYHGHVFDLSDPGFSHGESLGNSDFHKFRAGHFRNSHLVHGFTPQEAKFLFGNFSSVAVERHSIENALTGEPSSAVLVVSAIK
jgi:SAM-dependent methyltransferase